MPAASQQQQKLMGIVSALQKGDMKPSQASGKAKEMAKSMKKGDVKDFASTKHKGLPKKVKKEEVIENAKFYAVRKPSGELSEKDMVCEFNPLEGIQPLNIGMEDVQTVTADITQAQEIAAEAYKKYMEESFQLEEKKGKVGDKLKKTIDHLEKKRKEHLDMAKEDPKNASQYKEQIAKLATHIDDLMSKMERIEKSKKNVEKVEDKKEDIKESSLNIGDNLKVGDKFVKKDNQVLTIKKIVGDQVYLESNKFEGKLWQWPKEIFDADVKSGELRWQPKQKED